MQMARVSGHLWSHRRLQTLMRRILETHRAHIMQMAMMVISQVKVRVKQGSCRMHLM